MHNTLQIEGLAVLRNPLDKTAPFTEVQLLTLFLRPRGHDVILTVKRILPRMDLLNLV
jgi:hypothetical protein